MKPRFSTSAALRPDARSRLGVAAVQPGNRTARNDPRWPRIVAALIALHDDGRFAVRIVDADCGAGTVLIEAARYARALGFTAIEGRGIDGAPAMIGRARVAATKLHDPAIGLEFELADMAAALAREADLPADIVLWHGTQPDDHSPGVLAALEAAGDLVISDPSLAPAKGGRPA